MDDLLAILPTHFRTVRYNPTRVPDGSHDFALGANCQRYAYAVLSHFGLFLPPFRSSALWDDTTYTEVVLTPEPLDLLLFGKTDAAYGAHIAVYAGAGRALHLSRAVGSPAVWSLTEFAGHDRYAVYIGAKRVLTAAHPHPQ